MERVPRMLGKYEGEKGGPLLLVTAGVHGNEPSGVRALQEVFRELEEKKPRMKGTFIGIAGNQEGLQQNQRFIDEDLNRTWTDEKLQRDPTTHEEKEMQEIIQILKDYGPDKYPQRYFVDCHTTSSSSLPYISVQDVGGNNEFAHRFPVYIVKGFSDIVDGSIDKYFSKNGLTGFTFEGGQHEAEETQRNQESLIWLALKKACDLELEGLSCYPGCYEVFARQYPEGQKTFEIIHRHGLEKGDSFEMRPGFENFEQIQDDQLLALQNGKEIRSRWDATIFMPLYQSQGNDGFFIIKEVD